MAHSRPQENQEQNGGGLFGLLRAAAGALSRRYDFAGRVGMSYAHSTTGVFQRNLYQALGYDLKLETENYRQRYQRGGISQRVVEAEPRATWISGAQIVEDPDPRTETQFESAIIELFDGLDLWARLQRADILAGLGHYAVLLLGAEGELDTPLPRMTGPESLLYARPIAEDRAAIESLVQDKEDRRYGQPEFYKVRLDDKSQITKKVHHTRIVHVAENTLEDDVYGRPRLRAVWNYLNDLDKIVGGGAEAAWQRMQPGMQLDLDPAVAAELDSTEEDKLDDEITEYLHDPMKRVLRTQGVTIKTLAATVAAFGPNAKAVLDMIAGTTGIPVRILLGSERGELASSQDRTNWADRIAERWSEFAVPLVRALIDRLIAVGALPEPDQYEVVWPDSEVLDEGEKAEVADKTASANQRQFASGGGPIMTGDEIRERVFGLGPIEDAGGEPPVEPRSSSERLAAAKMRMAGRRGAADLADSEPNEPEWRAVHRAADSHRDPLARFFISAWEETGEEIDGDRLESALGAVNVTSLRKATERDPGAVRDAELDLLLAAPMAVVDEALEALDDRLSETMPDRLHAVLADGGQESARSIRSRGSFFPSSPRARGAQEEEAGRPPPVFKVIWDATNPNAVEWAANRSAELVTEVGPETRAAIRELVADALSTGVPPARLVRKVRRVIGLRSDQVVTLRNFVARLEADGVAGAVIRRREARRAAQLQRTRALLIARTETMRAANQGLRHLWLQSQARGQIKPDQQRVWIVTPDDRLRDSHAELEGALAPIDGDFDAGIEPGEEPRCRCSQGLATPEDLEAAA